jgi:hypothetical protein
MKCAEYFYSERQANDFIAGLHEGAEPEMVKTMDEDTQEDVFAVYYIPPKM